MVLFFLTMTTVGCMTAVAVVCVFRYRAEQLVCRKPERKLVVVAASLVAVALSAASIRPALALACTGIPVAIALMLCAPYVLVWYIASIKSRHGLTYDDVLAIVRFYAKRKFRVGIEAHVYAACKPVPAEESARKPQLHMSLVPPTSTGVDLGRQVVQTYDLKAGSQWYFYVLAVGLDPEHSTILHRYYPHPRSHRLSIGCHKGVYFVNCVPTNPLVLGEAEIELPVQVEWAAKAKS